MKTTQSSGTRPVHQTVAGEFEVKTGGKSIATGFTDQRLSPHAGSATFWSWLRPLGWNKLLAGVLPQPLPTSKNHLLPLEKKLAFMHDLLCDARKLTHVAYLRRDPVVPELVGVRRVADTMTIALPRSSPDKVPESWTAASLSRFPTPSRTNFHSKRKEARRSIENCIRRVVA
jgi:hypothetical protein